MNWLVSIRNVDRDIECLSADFAVSTLTVIWKRSSGAMRME